MGEPRTVTGFSRLARLADNSVECRPEIAKLSSTTKVRAMRATLSKTVLVVDDQATVRVLVARILREGGYSVRLAPSGAAALYMLASARDAFDIVLTDLMMRGMNALEFCHEVRRLTPDIPIGIMAWDEPLAILAEARA